jgi:hypothetical protein
MRDLLPKTLPNADFWRYCRHQTFDNPRVSEHRLLDRVSAEAAVSQHFRCDNEGGPYAIRRYGDPVTIDLSPESC